MVISSLIANHDHGLQKPGGETRHCRGGVLDPYLLGKVVPPGAACRVFASASGTLGERRNVLRLSIGSDL